MKYSKRIGVLAFHGDVIEHLEATKKAASVLNMEIEVLEVRTLADLQLVDGLIIPGGESTTLQKLSEREGIWEEMKKKRYIFGSCAGSILLAKIIHNKTPDQKTLELMDIEIDRNAYGRQAESFEKTISTLLGKVRAIFIRAPKITAIGKNVTVLAKDGNNIVACEQKKEQGYYLATCFHPELTTTSFHEYFLAKIYRHHSCAQN